MIRRNVGDSKTLDVAEISVSSEKTKILAKRENVKVNGFRYLFERQPNNFQQEEERRFALST